MAWAIACEDLPSSINEAIYKVKGKTYLLGTIGGDPAVRFSPRIGSDLPFVLAV
jgi:hypothetical protein